MVRDPFGLGIEIPIPSIGGITGGAITTIAAIFIFAIVIAIAIYLIYQARIYNKKIIVFENISGQGYQPTIKDKARTVKIGEEGFQVLYLRRLKVFRTAYGRKMGKNTYWFAVGQDGYWYNIVLGDIDAKMGMLDIEPVDRDVRGFHTAVGKNIRERYRKQKFMEKYGMIMIGGLALFVVLIGIYFLLDKVANISEGAAQAVEAAAKLQDSSRAIISSLDNICTGGRGIQPG